MNKVTDTAGRLNELLREGIDQVSILNACEPYCKKYNIRLTKGSLSQYISGKFAPKQDKLTVIALGLNVSETWLMGFDVPRERDSPVMDAKFHASILKDYELLNMILKYRELTPTQQQIVRNMIDEFTK